MSTQLECPLCKKQRTSVIDSRGSTRGIRRRRKCLDCGSRFTTIELTKAQLEKYKKIEDSLLSLSKLLLTIQPVNP